MIISISKKYWFLYVDFENVGIHTFCEHLIFFEGVASHVINCECLKKEPFSTF